MRKLLLIFFMIIYGNVSKADLRSGEAYARQIANEDFSFSFEFDLLRQANENKKKKTKSYTPRPKFKKVVRSKSTKKNNLLKKRQILEDRKYAQSLQTSFENRDALAPLTFNYLGSKEIYTKTCPDQKIRYESTLGDGSCFFHAAWGTKTNQYVKVNNSVKMRKKYSEMLLMLRDNWKTLSPSLKEHMTVIKASFSSGNSATMKSFLTSFSTKVLSSSHYITDSEYLFLASLSNTTFDVWFSYKPNGRLNNFTFSPDQNMRQELLSLAGKVKGKNWLADIKQWNRPQTRKILHQGIHYSQISSIVPY